MTFKLILLVFCVFQLASSSLIDDQFQAYTDEFGHLNETIGEYKAIVTDDFAAIKTQSLLRINTKIVTINDFVLNLEEAGRAEWKEPGVNCVNEHSPDVEELSVALYNDAVERWGVLQDRADSIAKKCDNAIAVTTFTHESVNLAWWNCADDEPCKIEVVKKANAFIDVFRQEYITPLYQDAVEGFQDVELDIVLKGIQEHIDEYTRGFMNIVNEIKQCWEEIE